MIRTTIYRHQAILFPLNIIKLPSDIIILKLLKNSVTIYIKFSYKRIIEILSFRPLSRNLNNINILHKQE